MVSRTRISDERDDSSGGSAAPSGGADGGDIPLANHGRRQMQIVRLATGTAAFAPQTGTIRIDGVEAYIKLLKRGDEVKAMKETDGRTELLIGELTATVPTDALRMEDAEEYQTWEGYIQSTTKGSGDLRLRRDGAKLARNTPVTVLDAFGDAYLIETPEGLTYVAAELVSGLPEFLFKPQARAVVLFGVRLPGAGPGGLPARHSPPFQAAKPRSVATIRGGVPPTCYNMSHPGIQSQARGILGGRARRDNAGSGRRCESEWGNKNGAPGAIRTHDFLLRRQALYPLSYGRAGCAW